MLCAHRAQTAGMQKPTGCTPEVEELLWRQVAHSTAVRALDIVSNNLHEVAGAHMRFYRAKDSDFLRLPHDRSLTGTAHLGHFEESGFAWRVPLCTAAVACKCSGGALTHTLLQPEGIRHAEFAMLPNLLRARRSVLQRQSWHSASGPHIQSRQKSK